MADIYITQMRILEPQTIIGDVIESRFSPGATRISFLYNSSINDFPNSVLGWKINFFADDTNLFMAAKTMNELESKANSYFHNWLKASKLHLNIDKTCYSVFSPNTIPLHTVTIKVNDTKIIRSVSTSVIDNELKWISRIEFVLRYEKGYWVYSIKCVRNYLTCVYKIFILHLFIHIYYMVY